MSWYYPFEIPYAQESTQRKPHGKKPVDILKPSSMGLAYMAMLIF